MSQERYHGLDFVRAMAMLLGLLLHVCIFFMPAHKLGWVSGEYSGDPLNLAFLNFIHLFRMQLFFMMAGFFAELVIDRKGMAHIVKDRVKRIFIPFIFGILILMPLQFFIVNVNSFYSATLDGMGWVERVKSLLFWGAFSNKDIYQGRFVDTLIHFWFIYYLLILYVLHFTLRMILEKILNASLPFIKIFRFSIKHKYGILILGMISFPFQYLLIQVFFPPSGYKAPVIDVAFYFLFYLAGVALYKNKDMLKYLAKNSWFYLFCSIPFILFINEPSERMDTAASVVSDITNWKITTFRLYEEGIFHSGWSKVVVVYVRASLCWAMCFGFIGLCHRYLSRQNEKIRYLADSAYWVYWIHLPITFGLSKIAQQIEYFNSLTKCYIVLLISTVLIYTLYNSLVRYTFLGDYFMGSRKQKQNDPAENINIYSFLSAKIIFLIFAGVVVLGSIFEYNNSFNKTSILIESYVARKQATLDAVDSVDFIRDKYGNTPLHITVRQTEAIRRYNPLPILLGKTSAIDSRNSNGRTPIFLAVKTGNIGDVKLLINAGADLNIGDKYGHTPAHVAAIKTGVYGKKASNNYFDILKLLKEKGVDLSLKDYRDRTVIDCLKYFGKRELN